MESHPLIGRRLRHFEILEPLGAGGMGEVFAALDTQLGRRVALKVIPRETADDPERLRRFQHEARALAALNHPDVVTIHSVGEDDGRHFLTMELVEGRTLEEHLGGDPLPIGDFLSLARPLSEALAVAHQHGIVHRDLKPGNVMVTPEGGIKVLDFGLARSSGTPHQTLVAQRRPASDASTHIPTQVTTLTATVAEQAGITGTLPYMSPEQLRGEDAGPPSDVFSLGVLFFEMLTGRRPFAGSTFVEVAAAILRDPMPELTLTAQEGAPEGEETDALAAILERCLAKDPGRRFSDAAALSRALADFAVTQDPTKTRRRARTSSRVASAAVALLALLGLGAHWLAPASQTSPVSTAPSAEVEASEERVVVLPFRNLGSPDDAYFALGVSEEITSRLATVEGLGVVSRISAQRFVDNDAASEEIGRALGVDYILSGTVRWERGDEVDRVRVTPRLVRAEGGVQLWSTSYDRVLEDLFEVQSDIASQVIRALDVTLFPRDRQALESPPTQSMPAYQTYLRGVFFANRATYTAEDGGQAQRLFEQAVEIDPGFALAWAQLSQIHSRQIHFGHDRSEARREQARLALEKAQRLAPDHPEVELANGYYHYWALRDHATALDAFQTAAASLPDNPQILGAIAYVERRLGQFETSTRRLERARRLDPEDPQLSLEIGNNYLFLHRPREARETFQAAIALAPDNGYAYLLEIRALWALPDGLAEARSILDTGIAGSHPLAPWVAFWQCAYEGDFEGAHQTLVPLGDSLLVWNDIVHPAALLRAESLIWLGRDDAAREELETARRLLEADPALDRDPRRLAALGVTLAGLGLRDEALEAGRRAAALSSPDHDFVLAKERQIEALWARVRLGDILEAADDLERLAEPPSRLSPEMVVRDPRWRSLIAESPGALEGG